MKLNTTKRELTEMIDRLHNLKQNECFNLHEPIIDLRCKIKDLQKELFLDRLSEVSIRFVVDYRRLIPFHIPFHYFRTRPEPVSKTRKVRLKHWRKK